MSICVTLHSGQSKKKRAESFPALMSEEVESYRIKINETFLARVSGMVDQNGTVTITLDMQGEPVTSHPARHPSDNRTFSVGLVALSYAVSADAGLRADLFERFTLSM